PPEATLGLPTPVAWTVTNTGPSPARDATATIELPAGAELHDEPSGCTVESTTLTCTVSGPFTAGDTVSWDVELDLSTAGANEVTATVATNSIDPTADNDETAFTIDAAAPEYPATERISFSLRGDQPSEDYTGPPTH